jgi:hypothetical protein
MNKRLIIGLTLSAWCLYVASLFLPAHNDGLLGAQILLMIVWPFSWLLIYPFLYLIVNLVFLFSSVVRVQNYPIYPRLILGSAIASWFGPSLMGVRLSGGIGVGHLAWPASGGYFDAAGVGSFVWTASITLMAIATYIPVNSDVSTMAQRYFVKRGKTVNGPFSLKKIQHLIETKKLKDNDLISISDHGPWKAPAQFEALQKSQPIESKVSLDSEGS